MLRIEGGENPAGVLDEAFRATHTFKGNCGYVDLPRLERVAHRLEDLLAAVREAGRGFPVAHVDAVLRTVDTLRHTTRGLPDNEGVVEGEHLIIDALDAAVVAATTKSTPTEPSDDPEISLEQDAPADAVPAPPQNEAPPPSVAETSEPARYIRVDVEKLDALLSDVGELITATASVVQNAGLAKDDPERFGAAAAHLSRVTTGLHETALAMRMLPVRSLFQRMKRVGRDLRQRLGKDFEITVEGEDTEIDKSLLEVLGDPLVHLLRNAADHGVEAPANRKDQGKAAKATVALRAFHQGGEVLIQVADDGRGIDQSQLIARAP